MTRFTGRRRRRRKKRKKRRFWFQKSEKGSRRTPEKVLPLILFFFVSLLLTTYLEKKQRIIPNDEDTDADEIPKISYTISIFSLEELKKSVTRCKPKSHLIEISSDMDWVDVKAQLKIAICDLLFPQQVVVDDDCYDMTWCIPRVVTYTLSLHTEADYQHLMKKALKCKEPGVKILVDEVAKIAPVRSVKISKEMTDRLSGK